MQNRSLLLFVVGLALALVFSAGCSISVSPPDFSTETLPATPVGTPTQDTVSPTVNTPPGNATDDTLRIGAFNL